MLIGPSCGLRRSRRCIQASSRHRCSSSEVTMAGVRGVSALKANAYGSALSASGSPERDRISNL
jgi:hypothetical protein